MKKSEKRAWKTKKAQRHIGIDLDTDCFTFCILWKGSEPETHTWLLQGGLERFIEILRPGNEVAIKAIGNSRWFCEQAQDHVARVVVVAPGKFEVIRRSVKKTGRNDVKVIAFPRQGDVAKSRVKSRYHAELASAIGMRG